MKDPRRITLEISADPGIECKLETAPVTLLSCNSLWPSYNFSMMNHLEDDHPEIVYFEHPGAIKHPAVQSETVREICMGIEKHDSPIVILSNSIHVLNAIRISVRIGVLASEDVAIYYLIHNGQRLESTTRIRVDGHGKLDQWPDGFFDQIDKDLEQLM